MQPNLRVQDGLKRYWLCASCESRIGQSEAKFATLLFYPYLADSGRTFQYGPWLMHFCTSLSWRLACLYLSEGRITNWDAESVGRLNEAAQEWREVLLGNKRHAGRFQQHILPLDRVESATMGLPQNINRYLMRAIDMDLCRASDGIYLYSKLGRFVFLGFAHEPHPNHWRGTKVHANEGTLGPKTYILPRAFGDYLNEKARKMAERMKSVSERQKAKIEEAFHQNMDRLIESDQFAAAMADVNLFGEDALLDQPRD